MTFLTTMTAWKGAAPICATGAWTLSPLTFFKSYGCSDGETEQTTSKYGAGGEQPCLYDGGFKSFCCKNPDPYANRNCKWYQGTANSWTGWAQSEIYEGITGNLVKGVLSPLLGTACKGECPPGQVPIASDGTSCQPGTYSYYCCDNPNAPQLPTPGEATCPPLSDPPGINDQPSPNGDDFAEAEELYDGDCTLYALNPPSQRLRARGITAATLQDYIDLDESERNATMFQYLDIGSGMPFGSEILSLRDLTKRTPDKRAPLKFCPSGLQGRSELPSTYSPVGVLAGPRKYIVVSNNLVCGIAQIATSATKVPGVRFVVEHVFEKQSLRNYLQYMSLGKLPGGGTLSKGAATVAGVFDAAGSFFSDWVSSAPSYGKRPWDTAFGNLGHTKDGNVAANIDNLQICPRNLNAIKALFWAGKRMVDSDAFNKLSAKDKVTYLTDIVNTFSYMRYADTVASFNSAFNGVLGTMSAFAGTSGAQKGYDYAGALTEIVGADIDTQLKVASDYFKVLVATATTQWNSKAVKAVFSSAEITSKLATLKQMADDVSKLIALDKTGMMKKT